MLANISADKGVLFDFINNEKLKNSSFAVKGKTVNGYKTDDGNVALNIDSSKSLNSVVGHEITHVLEGTELYSTLQEAAKQYAEAKGEYATRMQSLRELYTGVYKGKDFDARLQEELTADIVGDYLFTDSDFVNNLSIEQPGLFKKIYNEIKYLCKVATAGSNEARALEKVKKTFEDAWKQNGTAQKNTTGEGGVKYSIRLTESDLEDYLKAGNRKNKNKVTALNNEQKIILTSEKEIVDYINDSIDKKTNGVTVAYGKVNDKLINDVIGYSDGEINLDDNFLEIVPYDMQHAYEEHHKAKEIGDIDLTRSDFENMPEYLDTYDELLYAITYSSGNTKICVSKILPNGRVLIIETVSKSRGALQFKNAIGVTEKKYQEEYVSKYKKRNSKSTRGNRSSNTSLHNSTVSNTNIPQNSEKSTENTDSLLNDSHKEKQLDIINKFNPAPNTYSAWVRSVDDIKSFEEALNDEEYAEYDEFNPDYDRATAEKAVEAGEITVYSSYPIKEGVFVTPSYMEAESYSGNGKVYSKTVPLDSVAWLDVTQGQYAPVEADTKHSLSAEGAQATEHGNYNVYGNDIAYTEDIGPVRDDIPTVKKSTDATAEFIGGPVREDISKAPQKKSVDVAHGGDVEGPVRDDIPVKPQASSDDVPANNTSPDEVPVSITTVKERLEAKLSNATAELENNKQLREESINRFNRKIADYQAKYEAKKNKDTKIANDILRSIERLKNNRDNNTADFDKRINDIEKRIGKITEQLQQDHTKKDNLERSLKRIDNRLEREKAAAREEFNRKKGGNFRNSL